jgi:hypothetical protein
MAEFEIFLRNNRRNIVIVWAKIANIYQREFSRKRGEKYGCERGEREGGRERV